MVTAHAKCQRLDLGNVGDDLIEALDYFLHPLLIVGVDIGELGDVIAAIFPRDLA